MDQTLQKNNLTEGPLVKALLLFTLPFLLSNLLQTLYGTVDTLVVGNFGSTAGVSAVATGAQAMSLVTFFTMGLSTGSTVLVGQFVGARDFKKSAEVVGNTIIDFTVLSIFMTAAMLLAYPLILSAMNVPAEALHEARRYMCICSCGIPLIMGYNTVCALLRAIGDSKSPLLFVGIACAVNVVGDLLLTGVLHMGATGVAIATVCAQGVSFLFSLVFIIRKGLSFPFSRKDIRFSGKITRRIARIGVPMAVQSILINFSFLFITSIINSMGLTASAAMGIGDKIVGFAFMPQSAFSSSVAVVVAQNIGANQHDRALKSVRISLVICLAIEAVFFLVCQFWPEFFPALFSNDESVIGMAGLYMRVYSFDAVLTAITFTYGGYLNGRGLTTFNMIQNLASTFLVRVPATYILSRLPNPSLFTIGLAAPFSTVLSVILILGYIAWIKKKKPVTLSTEL